MVYKIIRAIINIGIEKRRGLFLVKIEKEIIAKMINAVDISGRSLFTGLIIPRIRKKAIRKNLRISIDVEYTRLK